MTSYRIYTMSAGNHIRRPPKIVECNSDQEAIEQAKQQLDGHDIEVWDGARPVTRLQSLDK
jgi:hypothetical protein